uniref:GST N-terminal domain-containing protein n=1 Tax=Alexandrium monilatum TaxID=311494 RepID=A0A7S4T145_9DINO|mmetsp:Transcript_62679/g.186839  ORF Transcript_62679/g.186839 Transcript_62679/m.186839 type:complete len:408 (-) Transcript_62679:112-1335(-)
MASRAFTWKHLATLTKWSKDYEQGSTNSQSKLRLFGHTEEKVRVTLFRDNHAWCPYCQKVWLFLEEKQVPYRVAKVTMRCYGPKERWYLAKVPNGMLPAIELDGHVITESDEILAALETTFGPVGQPMRSITPLRRLERQLFSAWCQWLCYPARSAADERRNQQFFESVLGQVDVALTSMPGPFFLEEFSVGDIIFVPYVERMLASLFYYKGFNLKEASPALARWFAALEQRETYRGTQSDVHTHCHDLPPQMGGCYENGTALQQRCRQLVDEGPWEGLLDCGYDEPSNSREEALARVLKHREALVDANCVKDKAKVEEALRCTLTTLMSGEVYGVTDKDMAVALLYVRDRINVPRDMSVWAGRRLREALTRTASSAGPVQGPRIPVENRYDQQPAEFNRMSRVAGA